MTNPFKKITSNAETSKSKSYAQAEQTETRVTTKTCGTCGAPRPKKTNLVKCDYCQQPFMVGVQNFKADS